MMRIAMVLAMVASAACSSDGAPGQPDPLDFAVDQPGPFNVGYRAFDVSYTPPNAAVPRTIEINLWYPTEDAAGYAPNYHELFRDNDAFENAEPAAPVHSGGYPVHVYSHGRMGFGATSSSVMRYFASHGWVAIAPSHTNDTLFGPDEFPSSHYYERSTDISVALDKLADVELAGPIAADQVVMSGHSFGVFTAWTLAGATFDEPATRAGCSACTDADIQVLMAGLRDDRVVASIPMAGGDRGWFGDTGYETIDIPVLLMTGSDDDVGAEALFDKVQTVDLTWIDIEGGCHQLFGLGGCDSIDAVAVGFPIVNTYAMAFSRHHLLADDDATTTGIVDGSIAVSDLVSHEAK